jgi:hypothetical protein
MQRIPMNLHAGNKHLDSGTFLYAAEIFPHGLL